MGSGLTFTTTSCGRHYRRYCLFNAALYVLALMLMTAAFSRERSRSGIPEELSITK